MAVPEAIVTVGTTLVSKKPDGYDSVICDEAIKLVAATKLTVTGTPTFAATLSEGATTNDSPECAAQAKGCNRVVQPYQ